MAGETPNMVGRLGQVLYWIGCVAAVGLVGVGVFIFASHYTNSSLPAARYKATCETFSTREETRKCLHTPNAPRAWPYPVEAIGAFIGGGVVAWGIGRGARYVLKGD